MKNLTKILGIIALAAVIGFGVAGCEQPTDPTGHIHQWGEWEVTTAATCIATGSQTRTCTLDATHKETRDIAIDPTVHDWLVTDEVIKAPTCTETGEGKTVCKLCGVFDSEHILPVLGHDYGNWTETKAPTCTEVGEETRTCNHDSSYKETRPIAIDPDAHDWGTWVETTTPTYTTTGVETRKCTHNPLVHTETRPLAQLPITSVANLSTVLSSLPANNADTPYEIVLSGIDITDLAKAEDPLGELFVALNGKYVSLDLSSCEWDEIPDITNWNIAQDRPDNNKIISINLPSGITSIGDYAFFFCYNLTQITLPTSLISIGKETFGYCSSLMQITLPINITSIGDNSFGFCDSLTVVCLAQSPPTLGWAAFWTSVYVDGVGFEAVIIPNLQIRVPAASVDMYKTNTEWSTYADRINGIE